MNSGPEAASASCGDRERTKCAACGRKFYCGAESANCWCGELKLSEAARAELRSRFEGCLCRECLERFAAESSAAPTGRP